VAVTVASRDLPGGTVLTRRDREVRRLPAGVAPVVSDLHAMVRTLAAPVRRGEPVTDVRLIGPGLAAAYPDRVVLPVRIADAEAADLLQVGDRVDLVAADPRGGRASYVAVDVPVLAVPTPSDDSSTSGPGSGLTGRLVVVAALPDDVGRIAGAAATDLMSVAISR
jgi:Flp pilus assembly protein CpaB